MPDGNGKVGAIGFCWGGGAVNNLAVDEPDLNAGVAYYGGQPKAEDVPKIKAALMLHYGGLDERINAGIPAYEAALKQAGKTYEIYVYDGANHAFNNDTNAARYDKEAADLAWSRTVAFLKKNLASTAPEGLARDPSLAGRSQAVDGRDTPGHDARIQPGSSSSSGLARGSTPFSQGLATAARLYSSDSRSAQSSNGST